jgi:hypothetical protein
VAVAEAIDLDLVFVSDLTDVLGNSVDLDGHVVVEVDHHPEGRNARVVYLLELSEESGCFFLVEGGVEDEEGDRRLAPPAGQIVHIDINDVSDINTAITRSKYN